MTRLTHATEFEQTYAVTVIDRSGRPADHRVIHFSGVTDRADATPLTILFQPRGMADWVGLFNRDGDEPSEHDGVHPTPHPDKALVLASNLGYIVNVHRPDEWGVTPQPVAGTAQVTDLGLLLLWNDFTIHSFDGRRWRLSIRVSDGGIELREMRGPNFIGRGWDAAEGQAISFDLNVLSGLLTRQGV